MQTYTLFALVLKLIYKLLAINLKNLLEICFRIRNFLDVLLVS